MDQLLRRLREVEEILTHALEREDGERLAYLDQACAGDAWLRDAVERALAQDESRDALIASGGGRRGPLFEELSTELAFQETDTPGDRIGAYRIVRVIGHGGMGVVCLAERADGEFKQLVALKVLARGMHTRELGRRFARERQILAALSHPAIARLLDGGLAADGRPFFAMEYIEGLRIDQYCDEQRLTITQRLRLVREVIAAVCYAHRNLVVHRDIKPSNILVTRDGAVKLLDFGIAKVLDGASMLEDNPATATASRLMTPEFASPEQVRGAPITTSSDVYQLGLLLYLLLCGHHPHRTTERCSAALERVICDRDPIPPSATVTGRLEAGTGPTPNEVGQARSVTPLRLRRLLGGDLDTITLKALRKEPERRYESAERLGEDIDRYLAGQPVTARRDTLAYRTKKFVLRHRLGVAFSSGLVAFTVLAAWRLADERNQARAAAANFEQIAAFTTELLQVSDPGRTKGYEISAEELLRWGTRRVASERETNPEVRSVIMTTLGDIYRRRGMYPESRPLLEEGLALREARFGPDGLEVATSLNALADLGTVQGRYDEAERQYLRALTTREQLLGPDHLETATTLEGLGNLYSRRNRFDQATAMFTRALAIRIRTHGWYNPDVAQSLGSLAVMSRENGHCDRARRQLERALAITERTLGPDHPQVAVILTNYGSVARIQGNLDAAEAAYRRALAIREKRLGPRHPDVISALNNLADCCLWVGKLREADAILARAYETVSLVLPKDHPSAATVLNNICALRLNQGRPAAARPYCDRAMSIRTRVFGPTNRTIAWSLRNLSRLRVLDGCPAEAVDMQQRMLEVYQAIGLNADSLGAMYELGATLNKLGRYDEAEAILQQSLAMATWSCASHGDDCLALGLHKAKVYLVLGLVQRARGNEASARTWWLQGMDEIEQRPYPPLVETLDIHARLLLLLGRQDEARSLISRLGAMGWSNPDLAKLIGAQFRDNTGFRSHTGRGDPSRPSPASSPLHTLPIQ